jgi:flagellar biosynthesis protein FliQ
MVFSYVIAVIARRTETVFFINPGKIVLVVITYFSGDFLYAQLRVFTKVLFCTIKAGVYDSFLKT